MKKIDFSMAILSLAIMMASAACNRSKPESSEATEVIPEDIVEMRDDQIRLAGIEFGKIEMRSMTGLLKVSGTVAVAPQNRATVCAPMGGFIQGTSLMPGIAVHKGQVLAMIENQEFVDIQRDYLEARNRLDYAEAEYKRHTELFQEDVYSEKNLQQVTADYKILKAEVKALEQKLRMIGIDSGSLKEEGITSIVPVTSPITGSLISVNVNIGKYVTSSEVMFEIVNTDQLFLELNLYEKDADKVSNGQAARFFINNETEQHDAVITQTGKSIGADRIFKVYASVTGKCENVIPGMYVNAMIETSGNDVTALPSDAIVSFDDRDYIFIFEKDKEEDGKPFTEYRMVEIQKGVSNAGFTEIILPGGFDIANSRVVITGAYNLLSAKKNAGEMAC
jgi:membrane fusion protein, heavy metal efflux system